MCLYVLWAGAGLLQKNSAGLTTTARLDTDRAVALIKFGEKCTRLIPKALFGIA
jgi:hypothetical protein